MLAYVCGTGGLNGGVEAVKLMYQRPLMWLQWPTFLQIIWDNFLIVLSRENVKTECLETIAKSIDPSPGSSYFFVLFFQKDQLFDKPKFCSE